MFSIDIVVAAVVHLFRFKKATASVDLVQRCFTSKKVNALRKLKRCAWS